MYRLLADVLNDFAFILDCLSPAFPKLIRVVLLSFGSILRALCGVAAGSAKASLSAHFAKWGNLGELNAKDSSQETVISLMGMLAGSLVVSMITSSYATWVTLIALLSTHLETNRRAVRAVSMHTLNRQRATLVYYQLMQGKVPTPEEISRQERIFEQDAVLRGSGDDILGYCRIGASMGELLHYLGREHHKSTKSAKLSDGLLRDILSLLDSERYFVWHHCLNTRVEIRVVVEKEAKTLDLLTAWWQAIAIANELASEKGPSLTTPLTSGSTESKELLKVLHRSINLAKGMIQRYEAAIRNAGWDLDSNHLETISSTRVTIER